MGKKVYILGAGASIEFLKNSNGESLSTQSLTNEIIDINAWSETLEEISSALNIPLNEFNIFIDDFFFLVEEFCESFDEIYLNESRLYKVSLDFEKIVGYLDYLVDYFFYFNNKKISNYNHLLHFAKGRFFEERIDRLKEKLGVPFISFFAREVLHRHINKYMFDESSKFLFKSYFEKRAEDYDSNSIFSLNYDELLYKSLKDTIFEDGFFPIGFMEKVFINTKNTVSFFHGHQNFYPNVDTISMADSYGDAFERRVKGTLTYNKQIINQTAHGISLITGMDKEKNMQISIYNTYINKFYHDMLQADELCCIGYSCNDDHINSAIRVFLQTERPITFVDYREDKDAEKLLHDLIARFTNKGSIGYTADFIDCFCDGCKSYLENNI